MFHYLGLALTILSWTLIVYILIRWRDKNLLTISKHAASSRLSTLLLGALLVGFGSVYYWWLIDWFAPHLKLSTGFIVTLSVMTACQVITGLFPDVAGLRGRIHRISAYTMALLYLPVLAFIVSSSQLGLFAQIVCSVLGLYMITGFIFVVLLGKARSKYLVYQATYVLAFQVAILIAAYLS